MSDKDWDAYSRRVWNESGHLPKTGPGTNNGGLGSDNSRNTKSLSTKTSNRVGGSKLARDGRQIADLEQAVHKLKNTAHAKKNMGKGVGTLIDLLGQEEERESQWMACVTDCEEYAARVPVGQTTGIVPVDLYRRSAFTTGATQNMVVNASGVAFCLAGTDGWHDIASQNTGILHADGASSVCMTTTIETYAAATTPQYTALPVGCVDILMPDVSSDFVSNAEDGTQYMQVAQKVSMSLFIPPNADAGSHFIGRAHVFQSIDPERTNLYGQTISGLKEDAMEEGSNVFHQEFSILPSGKMVPIGLSAEEMEKHPGYIEISAVSLPLNNLAYDWKRIGGSSLNSPVNTIPNANILFAIESAQGTQAIVRNTYVWQVERYASNKVAAGGGHVPMARNVSVSAAHVMKSSLLSARIPKTPTTPTKAQDSRANDQVPKSVFKHSKIMLKGLGRPKHGVQGVLSVVCDRMTRPGVHAIASKNLAETGKTGFENMLSLPVAKQVVQTGFDAAELISDKIYDSETKEGQSFWSSAWDFVKGMAPGLLELIPLLL
jgi:hypothetical protein